VGTLRAVWRSAPVDHNLLRRNRLIFEHSIYPFRGMKYAYSAHETTTINPIPTNVMLMNAEYQSHKQVRKMLKPRVWVDLEAAAPLVWPRPLALLPVPEWLEWSLATMDPAALAHGVRELTSPLSE
jgi:hypothetical protein